MKSFWAGFRVQIRLMRAYPDALIPFFTAPLFCVIFLMIFDNAGRDDLTAYAAVAPLFIALWWLSLFQSGWVVSHDRWSGTLEPLVAAPGSFAANVLGRVLAPTMVGLISFGEVWLVARLIFGERIEIHHAAAFILTTAATLAAMAGTSVVMAALFVLTRSAATFSNSASYPFYVLGGILVPVSVLPDWIEPLSSIVFLSWSSDLMRDTLRAGEIDNLFPRLGMILFLGAAGFVVGMVLLSRILVRVRSSGELSYT
jgi:ABC-2 type transport system permease protein